MTSRVRTVVAMPTFRGSRYILEQLSSIASQDPPPDEVVLFDDCSDDGTWELAAEWADSTDIKTYLHRQPANLGLLANVEALLERVLVNSNADVVVLSDQDDLWMPGKLQAIAQAFTAQDLALWASDALLVDEAGTVLDSPASLWSRVNFSEPDRDALAPHPSPEGLRRLAHGMTLTGATMAFARSAVQVILPFPVAMHKGDVGFLHDGWAAVIAACLGDVELDPRPLTHYRQHPAQVTHMSLVGPQMDTVHHATRERALADEVARLAVILTRLRETHSGRNEAVGELEQLHTHLLRRVSPTVPMILQDLVRGHYSRYAKGMRTALRDLTHIRFRHVVSDRKRPT